MMSPHLGGRLQSTVTCSTPTEGRPIPPGVEMLQDQLSRLWQRRDLPALRTQPKYQRATCARARHATWCMCSPVVPAAGVASIPDNHPGLAGQARLPLACNLALTPSGLSES
jgi:hypothetical protein